VRQSAGKQSNDAPAGTVRPGIRRDELIEVAANIFAEKGYANTSIQDIADKLGLLKGSLYYYIDAKEDLLFEVIQSNMIFWHGLVEEIQGSTASTLHRLHTYIHRNIEGSLHVRDRTAVFIHDFQALSPERQQVILDMRHEHDVLLRDLIRKAKEEKLIAQDIDVKLVSLAILTMSGSLYRWYNAKGDLSAQSIADDLTRFVLQGLGVMNPEEFGR